MEEKYDDYEALPRTRNQNPAQGFGLEHRRRRGFRPSRAVKFIALACLALIVFSQWKQVQRAESAAPKLSHAKLQADLQTCKKLRTKPTDPIGLGRDRNARYIDGHKPTLIKNATVWVGEPKQGTSEADARQGKGWEWITSDIFVEHGLIKQVSPRIAASSLPSDTIIYDAAGRQVTTGIIDMHSHAGVDPLPSLTGNGDTNEMGDNITPWARSLDGFKPLDQQIQTIKSGGVTTSLILPGSGNNIGGEAFVFKFAAGKPDGREELSAADMLADPDRNWRYMKMACGENAKRAHGSINKLPTSRMGESYQFRRAFEKARHVIREQDDWCDKAEALGVESMDTYLPQDLEWETLGAALRGQVHINVHCYTVADLEAMVDHTNEFEFPVRAFHHAHETFLVPEILRRTWGGRAPASALFADNMYYKAEAYLGSIYAGKHLYESGLTPIYVSDNPVLNAQHVVFEAAKAFHWGLPYHAALASVTTAPAELLGMGNRLGKIKPGYDADIVVWDSDPLSIGATPAQIWIDGTAQYEDPVVLDKKASQPIIEKHANVEVVETPVSVPDVVFTGVTQVWIPGFEESAGADGEAFNVAVKNGKITCVGACASELASASAHQSKVVAVHDGHLTHTFTAFGGDLGIQEIDGEPTTGNGKSSAFSRGVDGLHLQGKKLNAALEAGFTKAISATSGGHPSTSVAFLTAAVVAAHDGAVVAEDAALHYVLNLDARRSSSYSQLFGELRGKLLGAIKANASNIDKFSEEFYLKRVVDGKTALVAYIDSADGISTLLRVKSEVEKANDGKSILVAVHGGAEAHLVAKELADADVGVILSAGQPLGSSWDSRRALTGAPLTDGTTATRLHDAGVTVAIGISEGWRSRSLPFDAAAIHRNSNGKIGSQEALKLISSNVYKILGIEEKTEGHFMVHDGNPMDIASRVVAVSGGTGSVTVFA